MLLVFVAVLGATVYLYGIVPKGFIPDTDNDQLYVNTRGRAGHVSSYDGVTQEVSQPFLQKDPDIETFFCFGRVGSMFGGASNGRMFVSLKPRTGAQGHRGADCEPAAAEAARLPGHSRVVTLPPAIRSAAACRARLMNSRCRRRTRRSCTREAAQLRAADGAAAGMQDVNSDLQIRTPRLNLVVDRDKAAALGLEFQQIQSALYDAFGPHGPPRSTRRRISTA